MVKTVQFWPFFVFIDCDLPIAGGKIDRGFLAHAVGMKG